MILNEMSRDHSVISETAPKYCIMDSFVNYEGYSISSKGFLPTVVDIMVKFSSVAQSCPTVCDPVNCSMPGLSDSNPDEVEVYICIIYKKMVC